MMEIAVWLTEPVSEKEIREADISWMRMISSEKEMEKLYIAGQELLLVSDNSEICKVYQEKGIAVLALLRAGKSYPGITYAVEALQDLTMEYAKQVYQRCHGLPWEILETERCCIRETMAEDLPSFYEIYGEPEARRFLDPLKENPEEEKECLEAYREQMYGFYGFGLWTVLLKGTDCVIGRAGIFLREEAETPELGFVIDADFRKCGYAFEVCAAILDYARKELELTKLQARVESQNIVSKALLRKLGLADSGKKDRDAEIWSIEW